jgi:30S ribosomal protein S31
MSALTPSPADETMGKGDKKTRRGKIWRGTFGKRRPRARNEKPVARASQKPAAK